MKSTVSVAVATILIATTVWATDRPNVIVILADDLGFSDLGCYGSEIPTPHLDRLAEDGARFSSFYTSARCCPSRASLITGLHPHQAGIGSFATAKPRAGAGPAYTGHLLPSCMTLAELLQDNGYSTWMVGKWHMGSPGPIERGFENYYGYQNFRAYAENQWDPTKYVRLPTSEPMELEFDETFYATDAFNDYAIEFLRQARQQDRPFFLYLAHSSPHFPVQAPKESIDRHMPTFLSGWDALRQSRLTRQKSLGLIRPDLPLPPRSEVPVDQSKIANGFSGQPNPSWESLPEQRRIDLARRGATFAAMVEHVDAGVGRILDDLHANGELQNTLILFLSDNGACYEWGPFGFDGPSRRGVTRLHVGEQLAGFGQDQTYSSYGSGWANLGNTPLNMYKHFCHEGGIASPLLVHWPDGFAPQSRWIRTPAHLMDVVPTVLDATGTHYPAQHHGEAITPVEGISMLPMIRGESTDERALAFEHQAARGLRRGKWKLTWGKRQNDEVRWELFDLDRDRSEQTDLAGQYPDVVDELAKQWESWARRVGAEPYYKEVRDKTPANAVGKSPSIAKRPLEIEASVSSSHPHGTVLAQGGNQHGYALHFLDGRPAFDVRVNRTVQRLVSPKPVHGEITLRATLTSKTMTLAVNEEEPILGPSPGLIPVDPVDDLSIGFDERTAAGDYQVPNRFRGKVVDYQIQDGVDASTSVETDKPLIGDGRQGFGSITKPLFADPSYNGSCDPEVVWNSAANEWFIYYTARRATLDRGTYVGTPIGVISSPDLVHWRFRGYCSFDGRRGKPDNSDTHWAPGVIVADGNLHMFATYKASAEPPWGGPGVIRHYVAPLDRPIDGWTLVGIPEFNQPDPIDVSVLKFGDLYRAYYRVGRGGGIQWASSEDLIEWTNHGKCLGDVNAPAKQRGFGYQEAPYVFDWRGRYWMLTDPHDGLAVFHSTDGVTWAQQETILKADGVGVADATLARHPSVVCVGDRAFIFYHTEPNRPYPTPPAEQRTPHQKISFLQMAELSLDDGVLTCDRDAPITLEMPSRPNFVFILTDDQGWTGLSVPMDKTRDDSRSDFYQTPNIARLAANGMRFSQGYSPAPNCSPSRYADLTGKTCARLSFTDIIGRGHTTDLQGRQRLRPGGKGTRAIRDEDTTIPELLKTLSGGYRTAHFGKWHLAGGGPERHGFDISDGETGNREGSQGPTVVDDPKQAYSVTSRANEFMKSAVAMGRPFYCQVSHYAVHAKIQHRADTLKTTTQWKPGVNHSDPAYAAMVADLDASVGMLLDQIEQLGIADNTYIIYQADNGSPKFLSESPPLKRFKPEIWDGGIRVPTFLAGPGIAADSQCDAPVMGVDFLPTIWELAGGDSTALPSEIDGGSIVSAAYSISPGTTSTPTIERPGELVVHSPHYVMTKDLAKNQRPSSAILDGNWKLVSWYESGDVHLFDLREDISESTDVSDRYPKVKRDLYVRLRNYLSDVQARLPTLDPLHKSHPNSKDGDADHDGLPDAWEFRQLLTHALSADDDPDQDGMSNLSEFNAKSDPLVAP
ncbi:MAG: sulfatase-like hydrolase/transferase [Planctomycetota bacterium]